MPTWRVASPLPDSRIIFSRSRAFSPVARCWLGNFIIFFSALNVFTVSPGNWENITCDVLTKLHVISIFRL